MIRVGLINWIMYKDAKTEIKTFIDLSRIIRDNSGTQMPNMVAQQKLKSYMIGLGAICILGSN